MPTLPDVVPKKSVSGIAVDPKTLDRVIPESRRTDGTTRKQIRIRPGFTPQEDVSKFRTQRQQQIERNVLPKGHILGWVAPSGPAKPGAAPGMGMGMGAGVGADGKMSRNAQKHAKRKAKKAAEKEEKEKAPVRESWDDSDDDEDKPDSTRNDGKSTEPEGKSDSNGEEQKAENEDKQGVEGLTEAVEKLDVS